MTDYFILIISQASDKYGNLLLDFIEKYNLQGLREATVVQLQEFIREMGLLERSETHED